MLIESPWRVTVGTLVILDRDENTDGEIVPPAMVAQYQEANFFRAQFADVFARALITHTFSFHRVKEFTNTGQARLFALAHAAAMPSAPLTCTVEGEFGDVWQLERAHIETYQPVVDAQTFRAVYSIKGGKWSLTTAPSIPVPGLVPSADSESITADRTDITVDSDRADGT